MGYRINFTTTNADVRWWASSDADSGPRRFLAYFGRWGLYVGRLSQTASNRYIRLTLAASRLAGEMVIAVQNLDAATSRLTVNLFFHRRPTATKNFNFVQPSQQSVPRWNL